MHKSELTETVNKMFYAVDEHKWQLLEEVFAPDVLIDYSSMTGNPAEIMKRETIISVWRSFLPGFEKTHHQTGNFIIEINEENARVICYGTAHHFLKNDSGSNLWVVAGTYDLGLMRMGANWKIGSLTFNYKFMDGNLNLPELARKRTCEGNTII